MSTTKPATSPELEHANDLRVFTFPDHIPTENQVLYFAVPEGSDGDGMHESFTVGQVFRVAYSYRALNPMYPVPVQHERQVALQEFEVEEVRYFTSKSVMSEAQAALPTTRLGMALTMLNGRYPLVVARPTTPAITAEDDADFSEVPDEAAYADIVAKCVLTFHNIRSLFSHGDDANLLN